MSSEKLILQLKSESEILQMCLNALPFTKIEKKQNVQQLLETTIQKISQELAYLKKETDREKLDLCQLRINRILLQNEKIFNSYSEFKQIVRSVPRIQHTENVLPSQQNQSMKDEKKLTIREKQPDINDYRGLQEQINELKFELDQVSRDVQTHDHSDYKSQIRVIQEENARIIADYHLLKNDNTELLHTCNNLHRQIQILSQQNDEMQKEIEILKSLNTSSSQKNSINQRYLIPTAKPNHDY